MAGAAEPTLVKPECSDQDNEDDDGSSEQSLDGTEHPGESSPNSEVSELYQELCSTCEKPKPELPCNTCEPKSEPELTCNWLLYALIAVPPLLYYLITTSILRPRFGRLPPGPRPLPLVGNLLDLQGGNGNLHHALARLARIHGPVMRLELGPLTTAVVISSRDAAREAFTRHDRALSARAVPDMARAAGFAERSMIWLPASDPRWKSLRGIVATHAFSPRSLAAAREVRERKARDMVHYFCRLRSAESGQEEAVVVDVGQAVYGGVLNLVSNALFSVDVVDMGAESARGLRELVEEIVDAIAKPNVSDLVPFLAPLDLQGWRRWTARRFHNVFRILDGIIDRRLAGDDDASPDDASSEVDRHGDFLDELLKLLSAGKITRDNVTTIMFDVFAAGTDTIAVTVEWAMAELLRNPSAMAKVREEIEGSLGSKESVKEHDAASLPYLQAVVKEAMRLHAVSPIFLPHQATEDGVKIRGYDVPKGCTVIFLAWSIMRDPTAWERPDEFVPERFLDREEEMGFRGKEFEFIPFGAGRRQCPGLPMAERVVPLILASLLHAFEWRLPNGVSAEQLDVSEKFTTTNVLAIPLRAVPVPVVRTKL